MDSVQDPASNVVTQEKSEKSTVVTEPPKAAVEKTAKPKPAVGSSAGAKTKTVETEPPPDPVNKLRRGVIWSLVVGFLATNFLMFLRFFLPRTLFEPNTVFKVGFPSDFGIGVDTKFQQQYRIWVVRNAERLFVIYARCTHLGCTPDWKPAENKFKCPCHGSGYTPEGINFEGPAPRPMDRAKVDLDPEGQIIVDSSHLYKWPKGERDEFNDPGAYIAV
ncbi:MAG TPA: Rieske 2Fe-2S domain-containing protein [Blastocatellia bacterium]